jgi:hypothetical protein
MAKLETAGKGFWRRNLWIFLLCLAGVVIAPLAAYGFGSALMGAYEGEGGLPGFLGAIYSDAFRGGSAALGLVLSPTLFVLTWWAVAAWLGRNSRLKSSN